MSYHWGSHCEYPASLTPVIFKSTDVEKEARDDEFGFLDDDRQEMIINACSFGTQRPYHCFLG